MNVTIIHRYFWPESQAAEEPLMLREIVKMHLSRGDSVTVICGAADDCEEIWRKEFPDKVFIKAFRSPVDRSGPMSRRAINALRLLTRSAAEILSSRRIGLIYLFAYPPGVAALIIAMCRLTCRRTKLLFSFQDNLEYRIPYYPVRVAYRAYNRFCISHASMTMPLSEEMKQHLLSTVSERSRSSVAQRITVLNNFYSEHVNIDTITKEKVYDIIYAGNHGPGQNLSHFIEVLALCHKPWVSSHMHRHKGIAIRPALGARHPLLLQPDDFALGYTGRHSHFDCFARRERDTNLRPLQRIRK